MTIHAAVSKPEILKLYKSCLAYINTLKFSDKNYLRERMRKEFSREIPPERVEFNFKKGQAFISRDRFL